MLHGSFEITCRNKYGDANTFLKALDDEDNLIGVIVCKLEPHRGGPMRGYIAMLATRKDYRGHGIATSLVKMAIEKMISEDADEVSTPSNPWT
jgi:ribosomal protein S18 acetylase RimI-like enzyme